MLMIHLANKFHSHSCISDSVVMAISFNCDSLNISTQITTILLHRVLRARVSAGRSETSHVVQYSERLADNQVVTD